MAITIKEGETYPIDYYLYEDGVVADLTACTVSLELRDRYGRDATSTGEVTVIDSTAGQVRFAITSTADFVCDLSPYHARFRVVDTLGRIVFFPDEAQPLKWVVIH